MNGINILVVEDEKNQRILLKRLLKKEGNEPEEAENGNDAIRAFDRGDFDLVLLDQRLPDMSGIEVLKKLKEINPIIPVIIITAYANVEDAVNAMKLGAYHYLTKPINPDELTIIIKNSFESLKLKRENEELKETLKEKYRYDKIIYASSAMEETMSIVSRAAGSDANVLITGESGTGKELIAGAIHNLSKRNKKNFVTTHLAALPETLVEAELFGYEKGAFTGAEKRRIGKFEFASGGTIFLDEIGELPQSVQVKLLRVIQEKKIVRLGSNEEIPVDAKLICATNKKIENEVENGTFRQDLFYRLNVIRIHLPPLRRRKEDIPLLIDHFVRLHSQKEQKRIKGLTDEAMKNLLKYNFPGNIRELENIIEQAIVLARGEYLTKESLPVSIIQKKRIAAGKLNETIERIEKEMIQESLRRNDWNQSNAANELGISERVLRYKMNKYGVKKKV